MVQGISWLCLPVSMKGLRFAWLLLNLKFEVTGYLLEQ
jgi:hypothetical protein